LTCEKNYNKVNLESVHCIPLQTETLRNEE
jgi:hypothetical protein